jgi:hypothetical protein
MMELLLTLPEMREAMGRRGLKAKSVERGAWARAKLKC